MQVRASGVYAGEERELQRSLRAMAARRSCMDRCSLVHAALQGDGANVGLSEELRDLELHLASVRSSEQSHAGVRVAAGNFMLQLFDFCTSSADCNMRPCHEVAYYSNRDVEFCCKRLTGAG